MGKVACAPGRVCGALLAGLAGLAHSAGGPAPIIDINNRNLDWHYYRSPDTTCVIAGTAVSELRDDAFEVQFRQARGQKMKLFVLIPGLPQGGSLFMESPVTRERWRIFTENYAPALDGEKAEALQRNVAGGVSLWFTFEFAGKRVKYETISRGSATAASYFRNCLNYNLLESLKAEAK